MTYTTESFDEAKLVVGPITLTIHATATTTETLWVAHLDDVAPDGASRPLTQGALLGSLRELDPHRTWYLPDGAVLRPHHLSTRAAQRPVVPGEVTRYDVEIFPTAALIAPGHQLRLTLTTYDFPHLVPTKPARRALTGGATNYTRRAHTVADRRFVGRPGRRELSLARQAISRLAQAIRARSADCVGSSAHPIAHSVCAPSVPRTNVAVSLPDRIW